MIRSHDWAVRITHKPTGITATRTQQFFRNQHLARESAMRYIRSRIYMLGHPPMREKELLIEIT